MALEIERKFLVIGTQWRTGTGTPLVQGYLNRDPQRTVRIRVAGTQAFITVKGLSRGAQRAEFEYEIPVTDAHQLLTLCLEPTIEKIRYHVPFEGFIWDVDEFGGVNSGLVVAEIELQSVDQPFARPPWLGEEVTHDRRYFNSSLAEHPYSTW